MYRRRREGAEVLLIHPGGPFWRKKDDGAWSIPKGLFAEDEDPLDAARREFTEETGGFATGRFEPLGTFRQPGGKMVTAFAVEGEFDVSLFTSNTFSMPWPPRSRQMQEFPEADRAAWFSFPVATRKLLKGQRPILGALERLLTER
jgi:predicted NUDIX family NTP pyrophosphohydrolase